MMCPMRISPDSTESEVKISAGQLPLYLGWVCPLRTAGLFLMQLGCSAPTLLPCPQNQRMERASVKLSGAGTAVLSQFMRFMQRKLCPRVCWSLSPRVADLGQGPGVHGQVGPGSPVPSGRGQGRSGAQPDQPEPRSLRVGSLLSRFCPKASTSSHLSSVFQHYPCHFDKGF